MAPMLALEIVFNLLNCPIGSQTVDYQETKDLTQDGGLHKDRRELWDRRESTLDRLPVHLGAPWTHTNNYHKI